MLRSGHLAASKDEEEASWFETTLKKRLFAMRR
jgi:hypothetical protein